MSHQEVMETPYLFFGQEPATILPDLPPAAFLLQPGPGESFKSLSMESTNRQANHEVVCPVSPKGEATILPNQPPGA
jgi:hypothetical protein